MAYGRGAILAMIPERESTVGGKSCHRGGSRKLVDEISVHTTGSVNWEQEMQWGYELAKPTPSGVLPPARLCPLNTTISWDPRVQIHGPWGTCVIQTTKRSTSQKWHNWFWKKLRFECISFICVCAGPEPGNLWMLSMHSTTEQQLKPSAFNFALPPDLEFSLLHFEGIWDWKYLDSNFICVVSDSITLSMFLFL